MDVLKSELQGSFVLKKKATEKNLRLTLVSSDGFQKNNAASVAHKHRTKEVTSRFRSITPNTNPYSMSATSQRCPSPTISRMGSLSSPSFSKRSQSAERRQPNTPMLRNSAPLSPSKTLRPSTPVHDIVGEMQLSSRRFGGNRTLEGLWPSVRNLSASFQVDSVVGSKKEKPISNSNFIAIRTLKSSSKMQGVERRAPSRGKNVSDQSENLKPEENLHVRMSDQHPWPDLTIGKLSAKDMSRSMDLSGSIGGRIISPAHSHGVSPKKRSNVQDASSRGLQRSLANGGTRRMSLDGSGVPGHELCYSTSFTERALSSTVTRNTISLSSGSYSSSYKKDSSSSASARSMVSPSLERPPTPSSPRKKVLSYVSHRSIVSPSRKRPATPSSPIKQSWTSASSKSLASLSCVRSSSHLSSPCADRTGIPSTLLNYAFDVRKGKKSATQVEAAYQLGLIYNRLLQWRFLNAKADLTRSIQKMETEKILCGVWSTTTMMRDSIILKRTGMQQIRQETKLALVLNEQMSCLEDWAMLERKHSSSLLGSFEALKASILKIPVTGRAHVDVHGLRNAIFSAVDVIQATNSSVCHLLSRIEDMTSVVSELADLATDERATLNECRELLASVAAMQVQECSLRTQLLQLRQETFLTSR